MACGAAKKGAATACVGLAGAGVLVWWTVAFHPAHEQLWMVPVGLVLLGTPLIAGISLFASGRRDQAPAVVASAET
jgi:cytochrome c-type biogenesis protein CcmH/NrfF